MRIAQGAGALVAAILTLAPQLPAQSRPNSKAGIPRLPDGKPDLQGIWEVRNDVANGNLEAHSAAAGIRAGESVIVDPPNGEIPYQPWAAAKQKENFAKRATLDPVNRCFLPGVPRITYMPYPFQIFQTPKYVAITYEYVHASRTVLMNGAPHLDDIDFWMGDSRGKWEGDTLVVDVADNNADTWLDMSGDFHTGALHVVERYTLTSPDRMEYEATLDDPKVFTRAWTIRMPLYRNTDKNAELYEYECHVYRESAGQAKK
ncbi:MAG TPA: hypothetical protein VMU80_11670 [Bryobacteraceae bacterium]|nr:hypothetical protein [Bryobacteraceae bacterium]HUO29868.1 hypothetical protein [Bryobacteraceae bacterium]